MSEKKCLLLCLFFVIGCGSKSNEQDQVKVFLTEWSAVLKSKDESVRRFYDPQFVFPKVLFEAVEGLQYNLNIDSITIVSHDDKGDVHVTVPFQIAGPNDTSPDHGTIELTIAKTEKGFYIREMTQELAMKIKEHSLRHQVNSAPSELTVKYDSILSNIQAVVTALGNQYDSVVYFAEADNQVLFYVVNGTWENPYLQENQRDGGNYKMGVVTAENKIVIPVEYSKIYNPNGSFDGMIEVENDGVRGLFTTEGKEFIPAEFDGIYPTNIPDALAQVQKGELYGWVDASGHVSFDRSSHSAKKLFQSPVESNAILEWGFSYPGSVSLLVSPYDDPAERAGVIVYPSFVRDLEITKIANPFVMLASSEYGMGMTDTEIKFEKVESLSDQLFGLVSFFMEAGADARGYHSEQNDLLVVDKSMSKISHQEKLTEDYYGQDPCGETHPQYRTIGPGLYESADGHGLYKYYQITTDGGVEQSETIREYNFTKFAKLDESYLAPCHYESFEYDGDWSSNKPNMVVISGFSIEELDVMRNEIFAEYGLIFKSPKWKNYFEAKSWYKPQYDNVDQFMSEIDKFNVKFLLEYKRLHEDLEAQRDSIQFMWVG